MSDERAKILRALEDLAEVKAGLSGPERKRLEEIERTLRSALLEKGE